MKKAVKTFLIVFLILIILMLLFLLAYHMYVNKTNKLSPEETIKKYMEYWVDDSTWGMKSLESKKADFIDVIRNSHRAKEIKVVGIEDETEKEIDSIVEQYDGKFTKDELKIYRVSFNTISDDECWNGGHIFNIRLVNEKQGWCVLSFGHI